MTFVLRVLKRYLFIGLYSYYCYCELNVNTVGALRCQALNGPFRFESLLRQQICALYTRLRAMYAQSLNAPPFRTAALRVQQ